MKTAQQEQPTTFSEELDARYMDLLKTKAPYAQCKHELRKLEERWLRRAKTDSQRLSVQRNIASTLLTEAYSRGMPWQEFGRLLRRIEKLGFDDLGMRVHVACLYVQSLARYPRQSRTAGLMLEDVERRVRRLRRENPLREEHMESITHAKRTPRC